MEWDYSGRKERDGQKKKKGKANESEKKKRAKDEVNGQGGKWADDIGNCFVATLTTRNFSVPIITQQGSYSELCIRTELK